MPSIETSVALLVCHVNDAEPPAWIVFGSTEIEAVGAGGGGGGGGGGGAAFFPHAPSVRRAPSAIINRIHFILSCFTLYFLPATPIIAGQTKSFGFCTDLLFPTPIRLRVASSKSQLLNFGAVGQHAPDLQASGAIRLKHDVPIIRRPAWEVVAPPIVRELHPLLAGNVHQIKIGSSRLARPVSSNPGKSEELPVRRPVRRNRISLIGHA